MEYALVEIVNPVNEVVNSGRVVIRERQRDGSIEWREHNWKWKCHGTLGGLTWMTMQEIQWLILSR